MQSEINGGARFCRNCAALFLDGRCHRHPPQVIPPNADWSTWPLIKPGALGCLEFVAKESSEPLRSTIPVQSEKGHERGRRKATVPSPMAGTELLSSL